MFVLLIFGLGLAGALAAAITCWLLGASSLWIVFGHLGGGLLGALVVIGMACLRTERPEPAR
ncbi:hypothetical protein DVR11_14005 [Paracoccus versutus]|nr:hypothetical protein DVR11_14005 [Paracoccus versutus]